MELTLNNHSIGQFGIRAYGGALPASEVSICNDHFRIFKEGVLFGLIAVEEEIEKIERQIKALKSDD